MSYLMQIRKDIQAEDFAVPVGEGYCSGSKPLETRWINDDQEFQVLLNGQWQEAESIDWEDVDQN
jgi:hypothetical protein